MRATKVWCLGSEDSRLRIPFYAKLIEAGLEMPAVGTSKPARFIDRNIPYLGYELDRFFDLAGNWRTFCRLAGLIGVHKPNIMQGFDTKPSLLHRWQSAVPVPATPSGRSTPWGLCFSPNASSIRVLRPTCRALQRHVRSHTALTVFQNQRDFDYFSANGLVDSRRSRLIPNPGIDIEASTSMMPGAARRSRLRRELGIENNTVIATVTRLTGQKGITTLLEAASALAKAGGPPAMPGRHS